jgi:hypothetical protein
MAGALWHHDDGDGSGLRQPRRRKSLEGNWRAEQILVLKQRLSLYRSYRDQINDCDQEIEKLVAAFESKADPAEKPPLDRDYCDRRPKPLASPYLIVTR